MPVDEIWRTKLPNLASAMDQTSASGLGMCFYRAAALVLDLPASEMVFATFKGAPPEEVAKNPRHSPTPFIHAFVEWHGQVLAPTLFDGRAPFMMDREPYYRANAARDFHRLTRVAVRRVAAESGMLDWLKGKPVAGIPTALLAAAGVKWRPSPDGGGVLPLEEYSGGILRYATKGTER